MMSWAAITDIDGADERSAEFVRVVHVANVSDYSVAVVDWRVRGLLGGGRNALVRNQSFLFADERDGVRATVIVVVG